MEHSRRTVVKAGVWTVPTIAVTSTAPAFAASQYGALQLVVPDPRVNGQENYYRVTVTNLGPGAIPAGELTFAVTLDDPNTTWGGYTSDLQYWSDAKPTVANGVLTYSFTSIQEFSSGEENGFFLIILNCTKPSGSGASTALMSASAPDHSPASQRVQAYRNP